MEPHNVHSFYRIWFTWVDPIILVFTVLGVLWTPEVLMDGFIPASLSLPNPDHNFLFHQLGALYLFMAIIMAFVLRASPQIKMWRIVQAAVLLVDVSLLVSLYVSLDHQGRLEMATWRGQDWGNLFFTGGVTVIRSLFLAGVGVKAETKAKTI